MRPIDDTAPSDLGETLQLVSDVRTRRHLRSAASLTLTVPTTGRTTLGDRAFPVAAAVLGMLYLCRLSRPTHC